MGETEMRKPRLGSIYQRGAIWWVKYYRNGQVFRESSESTEYTDAENLLKKRNGEIVTGRFAGLTPERIRFSDLAEDVKRDYIDNGRITIAHVERRLKLHLLPAF